MCWWFLDISSFSTESLAGSAPDDRMVYIEASIADVQHKNSLYEALDANEQNPHKV
jgi:hypothetical protein